MENNICSSISDLKSYSLSSSTDSLRSHLVTVHNLKRESLDYKQSAEIMTAETEQVAKLDDFQSVAGSLARIRRVVDRTINTSSAPLASMNLQWIPFSGDLAHVTRRKTSKAWSFMGQLVRVDEDCSAFPSDGDEMQVLQSLLSDLLYCRFCFDEQMNEGDGSLAKVYCTSTTTSSGNHLAHAVAKHGIRFDKDLAIQVKVEDDDWSDLQLSVSEQFSVADGSAIVRPSEIRELDYKRDFVMMACSDLSPMSVIDQPGFRAFCEKHTILDLPSRFALSTSVLNLEFEALKEGIVDVLACCIGGTLMFDCWRDGSSASLGRRFFAVRFSFVHNWTFEVVTLAVRSVAGLTGLTPATAAVVRDAMAQFLPQNGRKCALFNTTPDTPDMKSLSTMLGHERVTCLADSVNRMLTLDSLHRVPALTLLLTKCRAIVVAVHFDGYSFNMQQELDVQKHEFDMLEQMAEVHELLRLDDRNPLCDDVDDQQMQTVESGMPTRWTVILATVNALLDNRRPVEDALRRAGRAHLCPSADEVDLLTQLRDFLTPFQQFSLLAAECSPNLSLVPLIRTRIQRQCGHCTTDAVNGNDSDADAPMDKMRQLVNSALDVRLPLTDIVRLNVCFDPAVRDVLLPRAECEEILTSAFRRLRDSPLAEHLPRTAVNSPECALADDDSIDGSVTAKRLRLSLLMESSCKSSASWKAGDSAPSDLEAGDEIRRYLTLHDDAPALEFWKRHAQSLPILAVMARVYLAVCPGCVPFDRLFSSKSLVVNDRLCSLPPYRVNMMAFVHDNSKSSFLLAADSTRQ